MAHIIFRSFIALFFAFLTVPDAVAQQGAARAGVYDGYAYGDCSAAKTPIVRIVLIQGLVPEGVPSSRPTPSIEFLIGGGPDVLATPTHPLSAEAFKTGKGAAAISCPVVGDCAPAQSGTLNIKRGADGAISGDFQATWTGVPPRSGKFADVSLRESGKKCG
jgi:hypothetical protein